MRMRSAADLSSASWLGLASTTCGSWMAGARLVTRPASPPTASTSALRSVEVVTTAMTPPGAGTAASRTRRNAQSTPLLPGGTLPRRDAPLLLGDEDVLGHHAVHALADVDHLAHPAVGHHGGE